MAVITARAPVRPATSSARGMAGTSGGESGNPVIATSPLMASATVPNPGRCRYGPVWPNPEIRRTTRRGFRSRRPSGASPHRSSVPGRKFSTRTSARPTRSVRIRWPRGALRLRVIDFLFRETTFHQMDCPEMNGPHDRRGSPPLGCSILMTAAPRSASMDVAVPPETIVERSRMVRSASGPCAAGMLTAPAIGGWRPARSPPRPGAGLRADPRIEREPPRPARPAAGDRPRGCDAGR